MLAVTTPDSQSATFSTTPDSAFLRTGALPAGGTLPLVLRPAGADKSPRSLAAFLSANADWFAGALRHHGAVLFRGFEVFTAPEFESVALSISPDLGTAYLGTSPRNSLTKHVFTASELPPFYPIPQHIEMSFLKSTPKRLFFHAQSPSKGVGGETPMCDFAAVWRDLDPAVRRKFETLGVTNIRNYAGPPKPGAQAAKLDPSKLKRWDEMFATTDKAEVERIAKSEDLTVEWLEGDRLRLTNTQPAVRTHPETGVPVWFNHTQVFHPTQAYGEFLRISKVQRPLETLGLAAASYALLLRTRLARAEKDLGMYCTYGDGTPIPDSDVEAVRDAIWKNLVATKWETGDIFAIDNLRVSHGRLPYRGPRLITVAWS
jgi:alpha-ketoglutarate-dependent taurine dioxygenase